jgi:hypothetical protein
MLVGAKEGAVGAAVETPAAAVGLGVAPTADGAVVACAVGSADGLHVGGVVGGVDGMPGPVVGTTVG